MGIITKELLIENGKNVLKISQDGVSASIELQDKVNNLRELERGLMEELQKKSFLKDIPTKILVDELVNRKGVDFDWVKPYEKKQIEVEGSMLLLKIID